MSPLERIPKLRHSSTLFARPKPFRFLCVFSGLFGLVLFQCFSVYKQTFSGQVKTTPLQSRRRHSPRRKYGYDVHPPPVARPRSRKTVRVSSESLAPYVAAVDALNSPQLPPTNALSFGNLTRFTALRNKYFDTSSQFHGAGISLKVDSGRGIDVALNPSTPYATGLAGAAASVSIGSDLVLNVRNGYVYNQRDFALLSKYGKITESDLHGHRHPNLARLPNICRGIGKKGKRPWLLEFSNVWMNGNGDIFVPISSRSSPSEWDVVAYQVQGGCCITHWSSLKGKRVVFRNQRQRTNVKVGFSVAQNHGAAYYHVTNEVIPRLLTFWEVAMAVLTVSGGKIAGAESGVVRSVFRSFGIPMRKMALLEQTEPHFFEKLFVPAPFHQDRFRKDCLQETTARIVRENAVGPTFRTARAPNARPVPLIVLIERASWRNKEETQCQGTRCMANLPALRRAIGAEFGKRINFEILSARDDDVMRRGISLFSRATVVIGVHGAGFTNIMYMRGKGTYAIHLGWKVAWQIYGNMAKRYGVDFVNIVSRGASQDGQNVVADIPVVIREIRRFLEREGFPLDKPRMKTSFLRSAFVTMRNADSIVDRVLTRIAWWNPFV